MFSQPQPRDMWATTSDRSAQTTSGVENLQATHDPPPPTNHRTPLDAVVSESFVVTWSLAGHLLFLPSIIPCIPLKIVYSDFFHQVGQFKLETSTSLRTVARQEVFYFLSIPLKWLNLLR